MKRALSKEGYDSLLDELAERETGNEFIRNDNVAFAVNHLCRQAVSYSFPIALAIQLDPVNLGVLLKRCFKLGYLLGASPWEFEGLVNEKKAEYGLENYPESSDEVWKSTW